MFKSSEVCVAFASLLYLVRGGSYDTIGAPLVLPQNCSSRNCTLSLGVVDYVGPTSSFKTRGFNGGIPGPTLYVKAGETLRVNVFNELEDFDNPQTPMNSFRAPNTTNLHTHGLHVSSVSPGDDIFIEVQPGEDFQYVFAIPDYHQAGTHWYHPHHHGSTALQAGGGAFGFLIIEDAEDELPPVYANMVDVPLLLSWIDIETLVGFQEMFNDALWQVTGSTDSMPLINGQYKPSVPLNSGEWNRFRFLFAAVQSKAFLEFGVSEGGVQCEMQLIAKDGVYLTEFPREISVIYLAPGSRADVAVRCTGEGSITMVANPDARRRRATTDSLDFEDVHFLRQHDTDTADRVHREMAGPAPGTVVTQEAEGVMFTLNVTKANWTNSSNLPTVTVNRPCYMANTLKGTVDVTQEVALGGGFFVNGEAFQSPETYINADNAIETGQLVQLELSGLSFHPFHFHLHPYQLQKSLTGSDSYFKKGDWHDTLMSDDDSLKVRFFTDVFTGKVVIHCHILAHEDQGMMAIMDVGGTEGMTYPYARQLEPTCYNGSSRGYTLGVSTSSSDESSNFFSTGVIVAFATGGVFVLIVLGAFLRLEYLKLSSGDGGDNDGGIGSGSVKSRKGSATVYHENEHVGKNSLEMTARLPASKKQAPRGVPT